ncbi:MAG: hypothetical protein HY689_06580 [Chloroflexi bacterium]|nr:hypothetical protein [Chloroflexota bacterium]
MAGGLPADPALDRSRLLWLARFRRLARDYERLPEAVAGLHFLAFAGPLLQRVVDLLASL